MLHNRAAPPDTGCGWACGVGRGKAGAYALPRVRCRRPGGRRENPMPAGVPQADARTMFTSVPDLTILAADHRRELLDEAAAFRLGSARPGRPGGAAGGTGPPPGPPRRTGCRGRPDAPALLPGRIARVAAGVVTPGTVGSPCHDDRRGEVGHGHRAGRAAAPSWRRCTAALERAAAGRPSGVLLVRRGRGGQVAADRRAGRARRPPVPGARRSLPRRRRVGAALPAVHRDHRGAGGRRPSRAGRRAPGAAPTCCPAGTRGPTAGRRGPPARSGAGLRRRAVRPWKPCRPRPAGRSWWWRTCTGPTAPAGTCWCSCCPGWPASGWCCWPATAATTCTAGTRCDRCSAELARLPAVQRTRARRAGSGRHAGAGPPAGGRATGARMAQRRAARRSEGNAFFAEELVSAGSDGHAGTRSPSCWWLGSRRCRRRPSGCSGSASVAGRRVRHDQLAAVSGLAGRRAGAGAARRRVRAPCWSPTADRPAARTATPSGTRCCARRSTTSCCPASAAGSTPPTPRCSPSPQPAGGPRPGRAAELAHHALASARPPAGAGRVGAGRRARPTSVRPRRSCCCTPSGPSSCGRRCRTAEAVAGVDEGTVTRWAARGASATGDPDRGIALGRRALDLAERRGDPQPLRSSVLRSYALLPAGSGSAGTARRSPPAERALTLLADAPPSGDQAWAHAVLARALVPAGPDGRRTAEPRARPRAIAATRPADRPRRRSAATADAPDQPGASCEEYDGQPDRARAPARRDRRRWPAARASLAVELRAHFAIGMSLLDEGRLPGRGRPVRRGHRARRGHRHHLERLRAGHAGGAGRRPLPARRLGRRARTAAELAGESVSATVADPARRGRAAGRGRPEAASTRSQRRLAELREIQPAARRSGDHVRRTGRGRGSAVAGPPGGGRPVCAQCTGRPAHQRSRRPRPAPRRHHAGRARGGRPGRTRPGRTCAGRTHAAPNVHKPHTRGRISRAPVRARPAPRLGSAIGRPAAGTRWTRSPWPASWPRSPSEPRPRACRGPARSGTGGPGLAGSAPGRS